MSYEVVVYNINEPDKKLVVAKRGTISECRKAMKDFVGRGWELERRPDIHSWSDIVILFQKVQNDRPS